MSGPLDVFQKAAENPEFASTIFAEAAGGSPEEMAGVTSVFLNRAKTQGTARALKGSSAYNKKSEQFKKASTKQFNPTEEKSFKQVVDIINHLVTNPEEIQKFNYFENVEAFGEPDFATQDYKDIGRQRFYFREDDPSSNSAEIQRALTQTGFNPGPIDGFLGQQTKEAIKAFQSANGLVVDGIVGPKTKEALFNAAK